MSLKSILLPIPLVALLLAPDPGHARESPFTETLEVARSEWYRGEPVRFRFTRCNATGSVLHLECSPCFQASASQVIIRTAQGLEVATTQPAGCGATCIPDTWEEGECRTGTSTWPQVSGQFPHPGDGPPVEPGAYYAETKFGDPPLRTHVFRILTRPPPIPLLGGGAMTVLAVFLMLGGRRALAARAP